MEECELSPEEEQVVDDWFKLIPDKQQYEQLESNEVIEIPGTSIGIQCQKYEIASTESRCFSYCCLGRNPNLPVYVNPHYRWRHPTGSALCQAACAGAMRPPHILGFVRLNQPDIAVQVQPSLF